LQAADTPLEIVYEDDEALEIDETALFSLCRKVYSGESVAENRSVDLVFCNERTIKRLNNDFRKKDCVTDVLSFCFNDFDYLGEIYICIQCADEQRKEYGLSLDEEVQRLFIHGIFHLLGFNHESEDERIIMERREKKYIDLEKE
jgi:probable rRNA maturation factor